MAAYRRQKSVEVLTVGIGSAIALAVVDVYYVLENQISAIYLLDAALEIGLVFLWICALYNDLGEVNPTPAQPTPALPGQVPVMPQTGAPAAPPPPPQGLPAPRP